MSPLGLITSLLPVVLFLVGLLVMDSYRLVTRGSVARTIAVGMAAALVSLALNLAALRLLHVDPVPLKRYLAPLHEELLKAAYLVYLIRTDKVGFMVDAGLRGFALGAGFALAENLYYVYGVPSAPLMLWVVRGLGTAVLHGSTTAIVGIVSKAMWDRRETRDWRAFAPGLILAIAIHSLYNHLLLPPIAEAALLLLGMPVILALVFERSDRATREWLGAGLDRDAELLELVLSGRIADTPVGRYLDAIRRHFPAAVVADMLCLLQIRLELSMRAKGILIARAAGVDLPIDRDVRANFEELAYLERSIGKTGWLALEPFLRTTKRDLWQIYMLKRGAGGVPRP